MVAMLLASTFALALALPAVLMSPLFTAHIRGDGRAVLDPQTIGTILAPPPPPPPPPTQVVDFKRVTTNHILLFSRILLLRALVEQTSQWVVAARRGVSLRLSLYLRLPIDSPFGLKCLEIAVNINNWTIKCFFTHLNYFGTALKEVVYEVD